MKARNDTKKQPAKNKQPAAVLWGGFEKHQGQENHIRMQIYMGKGDSANRHHAWLPRFAADGLMNGLG
jgi:hypothetical protein